MVIFLSVWLLIRAIFVPGGPVVTHWVSEGYSLLYISWNQTWLDPCLLPYNVGTCYTNENLKARLCTVSSNLLVHVGFLHNAQIGEKLPYRL